MAIHLTRLGQRETIDPGLVGQEIANFARAVEYNELPSRIKYTSSRIEHGGRVSFVFAGVGRSG